MKRCLECNRTYTDDTLQFCLYDGKPLQALPAASSMPPPPVSSLPPQGSNIPPPTIPPLSNVPPPAGNIPPLTNVPPVGSAPPQAPSARRGAPWLVIVICLGIGLLLYRNAHPGTPDAPAPTVPGNGVPSNEPGPTDQPGTVPSAGQPAEPGPNTQPGTTPPTQTRTPDSEETQSLITAIRQADEAEQQALKTLDPTPLSEYYTGKALQDETANVDQLRRNGTMYYDNQLLNQQFQTFLTNTQDSQAAVKVVETWQSVPYSTRTHQQISAGQNQVVPQVVFLQRSGNGWIVFNVVH